MTRLEFLLDTARYIERAEPERFKGFAASSVKLLLFACSRGYDLDQLIMPRDIPAMLDALAFQVEYCTGGEQYPQHSGIFRTPQDAAVHFLAILGWLEARGTSASLGPLLEAVIAPFAPLARCS